MKHCKLLSILSAALLGFSAAAFPPDVLKPVEIVAEAATTTKTSGDWKYSYESGSSEAMIVNYIGTSKTPEIPEKIGGKKITKIGTHAFMINTSGSKYEGMNITKVTIPNTVTEIDEFAFAGSSLTNLLLPSSVKTVRRRAFANCSSLKSITVRGATTFYQQTFYNCTALKDATLNTNCKVKIEMNPNYSGGIGVKGRGMGIFYGCSSLTRINGYSIWGKKANGEPYLNSDPTIRKILLNTLALSDSDNIQFVKDYCTALCDYIVKTETKDWMGEAVKARQLHDWLVRHVQYEDGKDGESRFDAENHNCSGAFLSYGLGVRGNNEQGEPVGETVCEGFAKAYTMLLKAAGIESYVVSAGANGGGEGHAWNVVKISGKYYECDVTWDATAYWGQKANPTYGTHDPYGTLYIYFLKSKAKMKELHSSQFKPEEIHTAGNGNHPYYKYDEAAGKKALSKCTNEFTDSTMVGIKDNDWNFDGKVNDEDKIVYYYICLASGTTYMPTECTRYFLYNLLVTWKNQNLSPASWCDSVKIAYGL